MLAFRLALESGADMLETDIHLTRDGVLVLIHDTDLSRTTDCTGLIPGMSSPNSRPVTQVLVYTQRSHEASVSWTENCDPAPRRTDGTD